ncbi:membrane transport protein, partial [Salmonella enterica subsp. enterica serovar Newport str. 637564_17]
TPWPVVGLARVRAGRRDRPRHFYLFSYYLGSSIAGTLGGVFWHSYGWNGVGGFIALMLVLAILVGTRLHHRLHA